MWRISGVIFALSLTGAIIAAEEESSRNDDTERVVLTDSYTPTAETEGVIPVAVYTAEDLKKAGANTPVEGLRQLPSFVGETTTENNSNGGNGQAGVNLRGLGQANVVILINSRRAFLGQSLNGSPDVNAIPSSLLARVEILKDAASTIYGSDAVAGVVNFLTLNGPGEAPYEGAEGEALFGNTTDHDAHVRQAYFRGGIKEAKVTIAASGEYYSRANLFARDRTLSRTADLTSATGLGLGGRNNNSGVFSGRVSVIDNGQGGPIGDLVLINPQTNQVTPSAYRGFDAGNDPSAFNYRAYKPAIPAIEKASYYLTGRYKIFSDGMQLYADLLYAKTKQDNALAPAPFLLLGNETTRPGSLVSDSIFNPFGANLGSVNYRFVQESGLRRSFYDHDYYRFVTGLSGDFNYQDNHLISRLGYDSGIVYERFDELRIDSGDARRSGIHDQIAANLFNPFIGQSAPPFGSAPTFVNGIPTGLTAAYNNLLSFQNAQYLGHSYYYERDYLYDFKVNAHLFPNLWDGGFDIAVGYEHDHIALHSVPDPIQAAGDQLGFGQSANLKTRRENDSVFAELTVPLITSTMNVPFVRSLELSLAYRYERSELKDQYTHRAAIFENSNPNENLGGAPRLCLRYQPNPDLALRASWSQSVRLPTSADLFNPVTQDFPVLFDPVKQTTLQPPRGVWSAGNLTLRPETTDTYTVGLVTSPSFVPGLLLTIDYYQNFTTNLLVDANSFAQALLTQNVIDPDGYGNGAIGVTRDSNGNLLAIDSTVTNHGKRLVSGLDVVTTYELPTQDWGTFTFSGGWNHFFSWKVELGAVQSTLNFLGNYSGSLPLTPGGIPFNKGFLRGEWRRKQLDFVVTGHYIGDMEDDPAFIAGNTRFPDGSWRLHRRISDYETLDLQFGYEFGRDEDWMNDYTRHLMVKKGTIGQRLLLGTTLTVGVNNAFDRQPPSVLAAFNDNYDTSNYSIRNRYWYVSLNKKF